MRLALTVATDPLLLSGRCLVLEGLLLGDFLLMENVDVYSSRGSCLCYGIRRRACALFNMPSKHIYILIACTWGSRWSTMPENSLTVVLSQQAEMG